MTTIQRDLLIHFNSQIRRVSLINEKGMELGKACISLVKKNLK